MDRVGYPGGVRPIFSSISSKLSPWGNFRKTAGSLVVLWQWVQFRRYGAKNCSYRSGVTYSIQKKKNWGFTYKPFEKKISEKKISEKKISEKSQKIQIIVTVRDVKKLNLEFSSVDSRV